MRIRAIAAIPSLLLIGGIALARGPFHNGRVGPAAASKAPLIFTNATSTLFQGTNDIVDLGTVANLRPNLSNTEFTISFWFRTSTLAAQQYVVAHAEPFADPVNTNWIVGVTTAGRLFGYFGASNKTTESAADNAVAINTWYHVAYTVRNISGTYTGNIWLNGTKQGSDVASPGTDTTATRSARIGAGFVNDNPNTALPFTGNVDEVTFWSVGFTSAEVSEIRNSGTPASPLTHSRAVALLHHYRMGDSDTFPTVTDRAGTDNGTCTNMAGAGTNFVSAVPP